jgi:hypothetical protein
MSEADGESELQKIADLSRVGIRFADLSRSGQLPSVGLFAGDKYLTFSELRDTSIYLP